MNGLLYLQQQQQQLYENNFLHLSGERRLTGLFEKLGKNFQEEKKRPKEKVHKESFQNSRFDIFLGKICICILECSQIEKFGVNTVNFINC